MAYQAMGAAKLFVGESIPCNDGIEAASQSWKIGALLVNSSGSLAVGGADPTLGTVVGVATGKATGTTGAAVIYTPITPDVIFEAHLDDGSGTYALLQGDLYALYGLTVSSGVFYLDQTETTHTRVAIVGFRDPVGTLNARVYFVFLPGVAYNATAATA